MQPKTSLKFQTDSNRTWLEHKKENTLNIWMLPGRDKRLRKQLVEGKTSELSSGGYSHHQLRVWRWINGATGVRVLSDLPLITKINK